ncbi:MAG: SDR family oxidoreductase [Gemmatimonadetes bacterium]|jgi:NAD(P)-dependent dehydrogenase (short-subunit alcohol dehydrogenase family)|nr:SDR family oxidoreductase [Gemmatimonadota bacterium]MCC6771543.1 SDR family oxidoreductase [Gemmatimonadaceae bacterium]
MTGDMFRLDGRGVVVVGAGSGIGEAVARACARQGASVACLDIKGDDAQRVAESIGEAGRAAHAQQVDIVDATATHAALDEARMRMRRLDAVVCTPSINVRKPILNYKEDELDRVLRVNVKGNFNVLQAAGRILTAQRSGSIVLFSSIRSQIVEPGQAVYAATKAAIVQMAKTAAAEFAPFGVRVNAVGPGVVETPLTAPIKANAEWYAAYAARSALQRWATPDEMAWPTVFLLSDAASYVTGTVLFVDGGWLAVDGRFTPPGMAD